MIKLCAKNAQLIARIAQKMTSLNLFSANRARKISLWCKKIQKKYFVSQNVLKKIIIY